MKVNDDNFGATQFFPWLAVDQTDGTVNVSWYDSRLDPLNRKTQMVYARSSDGGVSFEPNLLVEDGGVDWRNNVNYSDENSIDNTAFNGNQYGDYSGIAAANRQVHPLWTDSRMFFPLADTQAPTRREDNATSDIVNCSAPTAITAPSVNSTTAPSVVVSWTAPAGWGTNATGGTYSVYRNTTSTFPGGSPLASGLTSTSYIDTTGVAGTTLLLLRPGQEQLPRHDAHADEHRLAAPRRASSSATRVRPSASLQGTVTSAGNPISGATVTAGTFSATTNASGFYQFPAIDAGTYTVTASATGYTPASVPGVVVTADATTVQNLSLTPVTAERLLHRHDLRRLLHRHRHERRHLHQPRRREARQSTAARRRIRSATPPPSRPPTTSRATAWTGQTFRAGITGNLTKLTVGLGLASGTSGTITVEIRNLNGINPGTTVLATSTLGPVTNVGTAALYTTTFATPAAVVSGTSYSIVLRTSVGSTVFGVRGSTAGGSTLANGQVFTTTNSGTSGPPSRPTSTSPASSRRRSPTRPPATTSPSVKDSGSVAGSAANWTTLSLDGDHPGQHHACSSRRPAATAPPARSPSSVRTARPPRSSPPAAPRSRSSTASATSSTRPTSPRPTTPSRRRSTT